MKVKATGEEVKESEEPGLSQDWRERLSEAIGLPSRASLQGSKSP